MQVEDVNADPDYDPRTLAILQRAAVYRSYLGIPIIRDGAPIGAIGLGRRKVLRFTERQIELVQTFANQAVIAIENARLFKELRESLQQQTATPDVLKAISRATFDLPTVLKTLVEAAARLCEADQGTIAREQAGLFRRVASYGFSDQFNELVSTLPVALERGSATGRALVEGRLVHISDIQADPEYTFVEAKELGGFEPSSRFRCCARVSRLAFWS